MATSIAVWTIGVVAVILLVTWLMWMSVRTGRPGKWSDTQKQSLKPFVNVNDCRSGREDDVRSCIIQKISEKYGYDVIQQWTQITQDVYDMSSTCKPLCASDMMCGASLNIASSTQGTGQPVSDTPRRPQVSFMQVGH